MATASKLTKYEDIPCCPELDTAPNLRHDRLPSQACFRHQRARSAGTNCAGGSDLAHAFSRCSGPMALGDLAYSTTLLPGEKVRLSTADRRSRFSFDSETKLSYHSEQISEEQYRCARCAHSCPMKMCTDRGEDNYSEQGKWDFHGDASGSIGFLLCQRQIPTPSGSHSASSSRDYLREHRAHAEMSDNQSVEATRKAHSISIGEVSTRTHAEGETEDHFEASSREFSNPNKCHAITFLFYRINKTEKIKFELVAIERRVLDPVAPMPIPANPFRPTGQLTTVPQDIPATKGNRLESQETAIQADQNFIQLAQPNVALRGATRFNAAQVQTAAQAVGVQVPLADDLRAKALAEVDTQLIRQGLIDRATGGVSTSILQEINYERETSVPTAGVIVKSCLDDCDICEPEVSQRTTLELERMQLENKLLARQIELLDKSQEYRCCPVEEEETD